MAWADRLRRSYRFVAYQTANAILVFLTLNLVLLIAFAIDDAWFDEKARDPVSERYGMEAVLAVYPDRTPEEVAVLLEETWSRPLEFAPFVQFREQPFEGRFVNVDRHGFRRTDDQGPWPPDPAAVNLFVFGGSTTFGYGVADPETVPACLQRALRGRLPRTVNVYNFGCSSYYSTQERILFEQLLGQGFVPDLALFLDGLNEFTYPSDEPMLTGWLREQVTRANQPAARPPGWSCLSAWPIARAARALRFRWDRWNEDPVAPAPDPGAEPADLERVLERYLSNRRLVMAAAGAYGVRPVFAWQPIPAYGYDRSHHPFAGEGPGRLARAAAGYEAAAVRLERDPAGESFLWLAEIQRGLAEPLYVDQVHYAPRMSRLLADAIAEFLEARGLLEPLRPRR